MSSLLSIDRQALGQALLDREFIINKTMSSVQVIIVGQGFAGTAVAWALASRGIDFVVVDNEVPQTSSRVAAGLVTPVTGKRAVKSWGWDEAWERAESFYPEIERRTDTKFWTTQPSLRLFDSDEERARMESQAMMYSDLVASYQPSSAIDQSIDQSFGGVWMKVAARLDGLAYLEASRDAFQNWNAYHRRSIDLTTDIQASADFIAIPALGVRARNLVLCQGFSTQINPWFSSLPLVPAQGDILTVDIPCFYETQTIHRNVWITPVGNNVKDASMTHFLVGSTYRWRPLDGLPSLDGRQEILSKLSRWLNRPIEIIDHRAAIRPTSFDQKPLMGKSVIDPRIWVLNGLGAKGTLMAPWCAEQLVEAILDGPVVRPSLFWDRRHR